MKTKNRNNSVSTEPGLSAWHQIMVLMNFFPGRGGLLDLDKLTGSVGIIQTALNVRFSLCNQPNDHFTSPSPSTMPSFSQFFTPFKVGGVSRPEHELCIRRPCVIPAGRFTMGVTPGKPWPFFAKRRWCLPWWPHRVVARIGVHEQDREPEKPESLSVGHLKIILEFQFPYMD